MIDGAREVLAPERIGHRHEERGVVNGACRVCPFAAARVARRPVRHLEVDSVIVPGDVDVERGAAPHKSLSLTFSLLEAASGQAFRTPSPVSRMASCPERASHPAPALPSRDRSETRTPPPPLPAAHRPNAGGPIDRPP